MGGGGQMVSHLESGKIIHQIFPKISLNFFQNFTKFFSEFHWIVMKISSSFISNYSQTFTKFFPKTSPIFLKISPNFSQDYTNTFPKIHRFFR